MKTEGIDGIICGIAPVTMLRCLSVGLLASAIAIAPLPMRAQDGTAEDLGDVMSISLKDVVKPTIGFQGALQGAGTPNQAGIGGFLPLSVGENSLWFLDALVNVNFADRDGESSIINTDVDGGFSTSTRLGYRWLNGDRSWMYGLNSGYDTRTIESGDADGSAIDWKLQARLQVGEKLPPLNREGDGGQALNQYLRRRKVWMTLRDKAEHQGEQLTPYSFRHRYAKQAHAAVPRIAVAEIAEAMGHTIEVHLKSYARFKPDATAANFAAANV